MICWGDEESRPTKLHTTDSKWVLNVFQRVAGADGKPAAERAPEKWKVRLDLDTGHSQQVSSVAFSPDGKVLATASLDKKGKIWDVDAGKEIASLEMAIPVRVIAVSPDGKTLAAAGGAVGGDQPGDLSLWDISRRRIWTKHYGLTPAGCGV